MENKSPLLSSSLTQQTVLSHLKKTFKKYFSLEAKIIEQIFAPEGLIVTKIFLQFKEYFSLSRDAFLNYLTILEFIHLAQYQHHNLKFPVTENPDSMKRLIDKDSVRQILLGDLFIVLATQEVNNLKQATAVYFFDLLKKVYQQKVEESVSGVHKNMKTNHNKTSLLKSILFLGWESKEKTNFSTKKINTFYQTFLTYITLLEKGHSNNDITELESKLKKSTTSFVFKRKTFPIAKLISLVKNPQNHTLLKPFI